MALNICFAVSFIDLFITIQYTVFHKSLTTFYVLLYISMCVHTYHNIHIYMCAYIELKKILSKTGKVLIFAGLT